MSTPQPKQIWGISYQEIGIIVVLLCVICGLLGFLARGLISRKLSELTSENNPSPTQKARPNYQQMLEANGFEYLTTDNEGNRSYVSSCGAIATVKPNSVGFAVSHSPDNNCAAKDLGAIISIMYPSEVFDYVAMAMNSLKGYDQIMRGTAAGYDISVVITEYEYTLAIIIRDPP